MGCVKLDERCDEARALGAQVLRLAGGLHARLRCLSRCEGRGRESVDLLPPRFELTNAPITEADEPHYTLSMPESWNEGVRGTQVPLLINLDADTIRCVAGPGSGKTAANIHVVTWKTPEAEAAGMAAAIVNNIHAHPSDRHLAMVTRRQFGYWLRDKIAELDSKLGVELGFSEGLLESWAAREAFLLFCLLIDPDPPTWRAWLGYKNSVTGKDFSAPKRSAGAYLQLLKGANDAITDTAIGALVAKPRAKSRGAGGLAIWDRASRFLDLRTKFHWNGENAAGFANNLFDPKHWLGAAYDEDMIQGGILDLQLLREKTLALLKHEQQRKAEDQSVQHLRRVVERLRHQIATNEPLATDEPSNLQVATLWGAKGVTAEHVYILGVCQEALPGQRRDEYPGTDADYRDEQRRLFYVSITRAKRTLVISRALRVGRGPAKQIGLTVTTGGKFWADLKMSPFLHDVMGLLPTAVPGDSWGGCVPE